MTCHEVRLYFEDPFRMDAEFSREAEHLNHCTECARFVEVRRELGAGLHLVRESARTPSPALDAAVLTTYRRRIIGDAPLVLSRTHRFTVVCLATAAAAVVAFAAALFLHPARRLETSNLKIEPAQSATAHPVISEKSVYIVPAIDTVSSPKTRKSSARQARRVTRVATTKGSAFEDFRSLMYCDVLSCGGAMQLIRVQLPSSVAAFEQAPASPEKAIYADVLVGSDGIARGIRVVQ